MQGVSREFPGVWAERADETICRRRRTYTARVAVERTGAPEGVRATTVLDQIGAGGAKAILVRADDGARYWLKDQASPQGDRLGTTEQVVGRLGRLIGARVCEPTLVDVPQELEGEVEPGRTLPAGWSHGSKHVDDVRETRVLENRKDDDNRVHHAGFFALHDWLGGSDAQWLICGSENNAYWSHDHGLYLAGGPQWTAEQLEAQKDAPFVMPGDASDLDADELERVAVAIEDATQQQLEAELAKLPPDWPVTDDELSGVVNFAIHRRTAVAERVRSLAPTGSSS
jgi:hypothetical protein